jgi:hypothetical protein
VQFGFNDVGQVFGQCRTSDGPEYWDDLAERHRQHRRHVRNLSIVAAVIVTIGFVVHPALFAFLVLFAPMLLLELYMVRRSRPTSTIPDCRPPKTIKIDLHAND